MPIVVKQFLRLIIIFSEHKEESSFQLTLVLIFVYTLCYQWQFTLKISNSPIYHLKNIMSWNKGGYISKRKNPCPIKDFPEPITLDLPVKRPCSIQSPQITRRITCFKQITPCPVLLEVCRKLTFLHGDYMLNSCQHRGFVRILPCFHEEIMDQEDPIRIGEHDSLK